MEKEMGNSVNVYLAADNIISSLGFTTQENLEAIKQYRSGITNAAHNDISDSPLQAARIDTQRLSREITALNLEAYTRIEQLFILSIRDVLTTGKTTLHTPDCCLILSSTKGNIHLLSNHTEAPHETFSLWRMAERVAGYFGKTGHCKVISNACISGVSALIVGKRLLETGQYKQVVVSGADVLSHFITSGFASFKSLSKEPCRPFDNKRDGLTLGEACGTILLTTESSSGGVVLAGGSISNDANHISGPSRTGDGLYYAIQKAMQEARMEAPEIDFVNTHGTATVYNDEMESKAIHLANLQAVPVNSLKSYWGHTLGAAGVIESIACAHQLKENILYGTLNFEEPGVPMPIRVSGEHCAVSLSTCIKTASGFGGCNAAILLTLLPKQHASIKEELKAKITESVLIDKCQVKVNEEISLISEENNFASFIRDIFKKTGESNMKFYKMDDLCKLGYMACHFLLNDKTFLPTETGIILANANASLHSDLKHQTLIDREGDKGASPAVFVYTLPNVVAGEVCIRHKIQGENTFFIQKECDWQELEEYAQTIIRKERLKACIIGWCELVNDEYKGEFRLMTPVGNLPGSTL